MIGTIGTAAKRRNAVARSIAVSVQGYHRSDRFQHVARHSVRKCRRVRRARFVLWLTPSAAATNRGAKQAL